LIESDLVFDPSLLKDMLYPDRIAIARMEPWLNGSTVTINQSNTVDAFHSDAVNGSKRTRYKTVNIYSLSLSSWYSVVEKLDQYVLAGRVNDYYEAVFRKLVAQRRLSFEAVSFDGKPWYEVDTLEDLASAEQLFPSKSREERSFYNLGVNNFIHAHLPARELSLKGRIHAAS
jgi:NDP-sugar pyrophosphorylase family protein